MSPEQKRQMEEARRESEEKSHGVNAAGEKTSETMYDDYSCQINNE
jgi:hypothetical protein